MKEILLEHKMRYPEMTAQDAVKLLYQREFGGGHLITDEEQSLQRIREEYEGMPKDGVLSDTVMIAEAIGGGLYRVSLHAISDGLSPETLNRMFIETAKEVHGSTRQLKEMLVEWLEWTKREASEAEALNAAEYLESYQEMGYPMVSHSSTYRASYRPAYRIVSERYVQCLQICREIDRMTEKRKLSGDGNIPLLVAIDGCSASGKTTAAQTLASLYDCNLFHMDDFFLRPEQRTKERFLEPGGNVDYERFYDTVIQPVLSGGEFSYRVYDCSRQKLAAEITVKPKLLNIVEGAYSQHPYFGSVYDLTYWFFITPEEQKRRILKRNGAEMLKRFVEEWIPLEHAYFKERGISVHGTSFSNSLLKCTGICKTMY